MPSYRDSSMSSVSSGQRFPRYGTFADLPDYASNPITVKGTVYEVRSRPGTRATRALDFSQQRAQILGGKWTDTSTGLHYYFDFTVPASCCTPPLEKDDIVEYVIGRSETSGHWTVTHIQCLRRHRSS